jgi:ATP-binding cassette subfamily B protein
VVKAFARETRIPPLQSLSLVYLKRSLDLASAQAVFFPSLGFMVGLGSAGILWIGGWRISLGLMTLGDFIAFMSYLSLMTWPMIALGWMTHLFQRGAASARRLDSIFRQTAAVWGARVFRR